VAREAAGRHARSLPVPPEAQRLRAVAGRLEDLEAGDTERLLHERVRLGIMSALSGSHSMSFADLKALLKTSDGNLSAHARKLEDAGYVACRKRFDGRVPKTEYALTAKGRRTFARHLQHMEALIQTTRED
jgi:DNA-binding HxlR family transcriptional regulator